MANTLSGLATWGLDAHSDVSHYPGAVQPDFARWGFAVRPGMGRLSGEENLNVVTTLKWITVDHGRVQIPF
jgi:phenylalanine-4-hydroxylase